MVAKTPLEEEGKEEEEEEEDESRKVWFSRCNVYGHMP